MKNKTNIPKRVQKQVSLPQEYWNAIEGNIDNVWVRSVGDALMLITDKVYPTLSKGNVLSLKELKSTEPPKESEVKVSEQVQKSEPKVNEPQPCCVCRHPEKEHINGVCDILTCKCQEYIFSQDMTDIHHKIAEEMNKLTKERGIVRPQPKRKSDVKEEPVAGNPTNDPYWVDICECGHGSGVHIPDCNCGCKAFVLDSEKTNEFNAKRIEETKAREDTDLSPIFRKGKK